MTTNFRRCTPAEAIIAQHAYRANGGGGGSPLVAAIDAILKARHEREGLPSAAVAAIPVHEAPPGSTMYQVGKSDGYAAGLRDAERLLKLAERDL